MRPCVSSQIAIMLLLIANIARASGLEVVVDYDEFTGTHSVELQQFTIKGAHLASIRGEGLWLRVAAAYYIHEDFPEGAGRFAMFVYATDRHSTLDRNDQLYLLIDGDRLTISNEGYNIDPSSVVTHESMAFPLAVSDLEKISQATTVRARIGHELEFKFPEALIAGLKEMRKKIEAGFDVENKMRNK